MIGLSGGDIERFWSYVEKSEGCWFWMGATQGQWCGLK